MKHISKFKEHNTIKENNDSWKKLLLNQTSSGKYWKNLHKDSFDSHKFLDRSDVITICKTAQSDVYKHILNKLEGKIDKELIKDIEKDLNDLWSSDDSYIGL
jgi:hypothetical protein